MIKTGWSDSKRKAWERQNHKCSICGQPIGLSAGVGHHIRNRSQHGSHLDDASNCEFRCVRDEAWAHKTYRFGNPDKGAEITVARPRQHTGYRVVARKITKAERLDRTLTWIEERCNVLHQVR